MSADPRLDALAESARNRGLKLVRSRVRTPGKRRFGKVGLTDAAGKPVIGMDSKGPIGTPGEVEEYLRNLEAKDWGASLDVAMLPRKRKMKKPVRPQPANDAEPDRPAPGSPKPKPKPKPELRDAKPADAARLVELIQTLGHEIDEKSVRNNLTALRKHGETPLVATVERKVIGLVGRHMMRTIHRARPVGRIPILVVAEEAQGHGIGRMLVDAVEDWCRDHGCAIIEVTSNDRRAEAHAFYRHLGYERTSIRFFKQL